MAWRRDLFPEWVDHRAGNDLLSFMIGLLAGDQAAAQACT
jgi:hypothetical protein